MGLCVFRCVVPFGATHFFYYLGGKKMDTGAIFGGSLIVLVIAIISIIKNTKNGKKINEALEGVKGICRKQGDSTLYT